MTTVPQRTKPGKKMLAARWYGKKDVRVEEVDSPALVDSDDALLRVTSTAICGSDLHMYTNFMPGMQKGDIIGHEFMGIVTEVGKDVKEVRVGDRVVAAFDFACGQCYFCKKDLFSSCDRLKKEDGGSCSIRCRTNPKDNVTQEKLYGDRTAGLAGYSHVTGGYAGGQAEHVRVPHANVNLVKIPESSHLSDEKVLFLSDILPTAWHANELGQVGKGDKVAIWGAGPVGILAARLAQIRGAEQVILIDKYKYRLSFAQEKVPGVEVVNFAEEGEVVGKLKELTGVGPDVGIDAVGCHYTKSWLHSLETTLGLETDSPDAINEVIKSVRKGGRISVVGVYVASVNHFLLGPLFEKGLSLAAGQTPCQKYWPHLLHLITSGDLDPSFVISHTLPLEKAPEGYQTFNDKEDECIKVVLKPGVGKI